MDFFVVVMIKIWSRKPEYHVYTHCHLFSDSASKSFKAIPHNGNKYFSLLLAYSVIFNENYDRQLMVLKKLSNSDRVF